MRKSRAKLGKRYQQRYDSRGSSFGFMKYPTGTNFYKADDGEHNILIIPYQIRTKNHPLVAKRKAEMDEWDYVLIIDVHQNVGPEEIPIICPKKNFGKSCPLCEEGGDLEKTSKRAIYNIINIDRPERGLHIFSTSNHLFQKELQEELKASSKGDELIHFADPEDSRSVSFRGSKESGGGMSYVRFKSFRFIKLDDDIEEMYEKEKWEEKTISLDECMIILSYDEIRNILYGNDSEENTEQEDKESRRENRRREKKQESNKCPYGHEYGNSIDQYNDCDKCDLWDECEIEYDRLKKE